MKSMGAGLFPYRSIFFIHRKTSLMIGIGCFVGINEKTFFVLPSSAEYQKHDFNILNRFYRIRQIRQKFARYRHFSQIYLTKVINLHIIALFSGFCRTLG
jgi:hypothetical protein